MCFCACAVLFFLPVSSSRLIALAAPPDTSVYEQEERGEGMSVFQLPASLVLSLSSLILLLLCLPPLSFYSSLETILNGDWRCVQYGPKQKNERNTASQEVATDYEGCYPKTLIRSPTLCWNCLMTIKLHLFCTSSGQMLLKVHRSDRRT